MRSLLNRNRTLPKTSPSHRSPKSPTDPATTTPRQRKTAEQCRAAKVLPVTRQPQKAQAAAKVQSAKAAHLTLGHEARSSPTHHEAPEDFEKIQHNDMIKEQKV